jgi:hypothetical protein
LEGIGFEQGNIAATPPPEILELFGGSMMFEEDGHPELALLSGQVEIEKCIGDDAHGGGAVFHPKRLTLEDTLMSKALQPIPRISTPNKRPRNQDIIEFFGVLEKEKGKHFQT